MSKSRIIFVLSSVVLLLPVVFSSLSRAASEGGERGEDSLYKQLSVFSEVLSLVRRAYVDESSMDRLLAGALDGTTDALDPLAFYVPAAEVEAFLSLPDDGAKNNGLDLVRRQGITQAVAVAPGSPGAAAGFQSGDVLTEVAGRGTRQMTFPEIQRRLSEPGGEVRIEVLREGQSETLMLSPAAFEPPVQRREDRQGVAVLRIPRLTPEVVPWVREQLIQLRDEGRGAVILDLRGSAADDYQAAYQLAGLMGRGALGELKRRQEVLERFEAAEAPVWEGEIVVLVDGSCLGAAEILTAALRQTASARVVGERTFGWSGRQVSMALSDGSRLVLSDAFYTGPDGEPLEQGLEPDVPVGDGFSLLDESPEETSEDPILDKGIEVLTAEALDKAA